MRAGPYTPETPTKATREETGQKEARSPLTAPRGASRSACLRSARAVRCAPALCPTTVTLVGGRVGREREP